MSWHYLYILVEKLNICYTCGKSFEHIATLKSEYHKTYWWETIPLYMKSHCNHTWLSNIVTRLTLVKNLTVVCGKSFVTLNKLNYHEMTHTGEKPFTHTCGTYEIPFRKLRYLKCYFNNI